MTATSLDEVKKVLSENLDLQGVDLNSLDENSPLFEGLGLDSLDAIELVVILKKYYDITIADMEAGKEIFKTLGSLRAHIENNRKK